MSSLTLLLTWCSRRWEGKRNNGGFENHLEDISIKVHLWQAEEDRGVGGMGRYMAEKLPNCKATFIPNAGHFWLFEHMGEMLDVLVPHTSSSRSK